MKQNFKSIKGYTISATDGEIGTVKEFYFDDKTFTIRYVIVETGGWLFGRKVLISPQAIATAEWKEGTLPVNLTKEQIKNSPDIDTEKPVSRQQEIQLYQHYGWADNWGAGSLWAGGIGTTGMMMNGPGPLPFESAVESTEGVLNDQNNDPHLRSSAEVTGYNIKTTDGAIGDVEDFIIDTSDWQISYMVVDTGKWFAGKKVIISPKWIEKIEWAASEVFVNVTVDQVKKSPEYDSTDQLDAGYEASLHDHYDRR